MSDLKPPWTEVSDFSQRPIFVCWETTKSCLLACRHCRARAIRKSLPGELDHDQGIALVDQLLEFGEPYPALLFTGGDPLMRPDIFELIEHATTRRIYAAVAASVTPLLNNESIRRMKQLDVSIMSVSLDGAQPRTHDKIRGIEGTWHKTVNALQLAKEEGLRAQVNTAVMRSNINELADIFHIVRETGAAAWEVFFLIRTGRGASLESLHPRECEQVLHFLYDASQYGIPVRTAEGPHFRRVILQRQQYRTISEAGLYNELATRLHNLEEEPLTPPTVRVNPTGDGKGLMFVSHDGEVYPSGFLPVNTGRVPQEHLKTIYTSNPLFLGLRDTSNLKGRCGKCEYRTVCGGSRSRAFAEFGDPFAEDPACAYVPESHPDTSVPTLFQFRTS